MQLIQGPKFNLAKPEVVIDHLARLDIKVLYLNPTNLKIIKENEGLCLHVYQGTTTTYAIRESFLYKLLKWFGISHYNIKHFSIDTVVAICNDNLNSISNNPYHSKVSIQIENGEAIGITSSNFTRIQDMDIINLSEKYEIEAISRDDFSMRIYTTIKEKSEPIVGDIMGYGYNIINSQTGFAKLQAENFILRYWCTNGATTKISTTAQSFNHYKLDKEYAFRYLHDIMQNPKSIAKDFTKRVQIANSADAKILFPTIEYRVSHIIGGSKGYSFFKNFNKMENRYSLFNFITHSAKNYRLLERYQLEQLAGEIL